MSLINDALKRASEAQAQAATRPRGPKGVEDLPAPMVPAASRERPAWLPIVGISVLVVALLGASGFFFSKWWKERQAWQPYVETPEDDDPNALAKAKSPPVQVAKKTDPVTPPTTKAVVTNLPPKVVTPPPAPAATNPPAPVVVPPPKPVAPPPPVAVPAATNPAVAVVPAVVNPPVVVPVPVPPPAVTNPPAVTPPAVAMAETNPPPVVIPPPATTAKKSDEPPAKVASVEFPELKLQGISRRKNKTYAVVNGKTLTLGDRIEGAFLLKIDQESVTFEKGSVRREFFLLR